MGYFFAKVLEDKIRESHVTLFREDEHSIAGSDTFLIIATPRNNTFFISGPPKKVSRFG